MSLQDGSTVKDTDKIFVDAPPFGVRMREDFVESEETAVDLDGHGHGHTAANPGDPAAVRFRPVVLLLDGSAFGYEAVFEGPSGGEGRRWPPPEAGRTGWEAIFRNLPDAVREGRAKLFAPLPPAALPSGAGNGELRPDTLLRRVVEAGLATEQIVLTVADDGAAGPEARRRRDAVLRTYRGLGFRLALSGIAAQPDSLCRLLELHPDFARADIGWTAEQRPADDEPAPGRDETGRAGKAAATVAETLLGALAGLARSEQIVLIADGVARESQLGYLLASGIAYGQGDWLGPAEERPSGVRPAARERLRRETAERYRSEAGSLSELTVPVETFPGDTPVSDIARQFERRRDAPAFAIVEDGRPIGLIVKEKLHQRLSGQFGPSLYWKRPVSGVMDKQPLIVDEGTPVDQVSRMAMAREPDKLYDAVVVTRAGQAAGVVSIRALLEWVTQRSLKDAKWANPLTGLPGNEPIRRELSRRIGEGRPFSVLYADLNHFKWFNDRFGFGRGDEVIRYTGETIAAAVRGLEAEEPGFVGHIGGDDFIAVLPGIQTVSFCAGLLKRFDGGIGSFMEKDAGPVMDRDGLPTDDGGLTLSLALLLCERTEGWTPELLAERSALLKKEAKRQRGGALVWERLKEPGESGGESSTTVGVKTS